MAPEAKKRQLPPKVAAMKARKRQKLQDDGDESAASAAAAAAAPAVPEMPASKNQNLRLDKLAWKEVEMPDRLDDFEGFFGLEEIDDVDVVREGDKISYRSAEKKAQKPESKAGKKRKASEAKDEKKVDRETLANTLANATSEAQEEDGDDEDWSGFSDEEVVPEPQEKPAQAADKKAKAEQKQKNKKEKKDNDKKDGKAKKQKDKQAKQDGEKTTDGAAPIGAIPFAGLLDEMEDDEVDTSAWNELNLSDETMSSLSKMNFSQPTRIQSASIPEILAGHDVIGKASTGSGKTLAYGIPILEKFLESSKIKRKPAKNGEKIPMALILSPTRELAHQISAHLTALCSSGTFDGPSIATLTGGLSVQKQQRLLEYADIVIGTPGRLWEVIGQGHGLLKRFKKIKFLVVDEADRLLSEGHFKEVEEILNVLDREDEEEIEDEEDSGDESDSAEKEEVQRQTLVFSATFHKGLQQKLTGKSRPGADLMSNKESMEYLIKKLRFREEKPKFVDVNPVAQMAEGLKEGLVECGATEKDLYLYALLLLHAKTRTLIFTNSISAVRRLHPFLTNLNLPALALHSQMAQKARLRSVERFSSQPGSILIATDVAARGLDIKGVQLVIHYHLPRAADMYVHRSGRTARGENSGSSILICAPEEVVGVRRLVAKVHANSSAPKSTYFMRSLDLDRRIISRLKPRATLAKKLADTQVAQAKSNSDENSLLKQAAEDLGVEYDSEELEKPMGRGGRGNGRKRKEREAKGLSREEVAGMRAELRSLLSQRVNVGVSERYLTSGGVDVDALLREREEGRGEFLGRVGGLGFD